MMLMLAFCCGAAAENEREESASTQYQPDAAAQGLSLEDALRVPAHCATRKIVCSQAVSPASIPGWRRRGNTMKLSASISKRWRIIVGPCCASIAQSANASCPDGPEAELTDFPSVALALVTEIPSLTFPI